MRPSNFHAGMIKALALSILDNINSNDYHRVIVKTAKMRLLASKLGIKLSDILPVSVMKVIDRVLHYVYATYSASLSCGYAFALSNLKIYLTSAVLGDLMAETISSLLNLPKLPA